MEDVRHVAGGLIRELLAAGEQVVFVPPKLMAGERRGGRERGKSDPIDALAIAGWRCARRRACPPPASMSRSWRCGGWPITAMTWLPSGPG